MDFLIIHLFNYHSDSGVLQFESLGYQERGKGNYFSKSFISEVKAQRVT